jgi:myo-inositol-1(or 4)-monophosphatase
MSTELAPELAAIARDAGAELIRRFALPRTVELKGAVDLVTDADKASEALILERLARAFPGAPVLAEEGGAVAGPGRLRFVVDPLDGTVNYAHGVPLFSVTLAALDEGALAAGVVFDPLRNELFSAIRGQGAFLDGRRLSVSRAATLNEALVATGFPYDLRARSERVLGLFGDVAKRARGVRRFGSAAIDLAWVAAGRFDGYYEAGLKPWDCAAGLLLVEEAGGRTSGFDGAPALLGQGEVIAGPAAVWAELVDVVRARAD